jgi:hypothetical protein
MKRIIISLTLFLYILNTTVAQYDDSKWEFGAEVGFAWVGFPGQGISIDIFDNTTESTDRKNMGGFHAFVSAKYNLIGRVQILGGVGFVKAKGKINKSRTTEAFIFSQATSFNEKIMQEFSLIEIPTYFRFYLLNERRSVSKRFNIFLDLGTSLKIPVKTDLSFSKSETQSPNYAGDLQVESFFGSYVAFGFSVNNRTTIAFTSSSMRSQAVEYNFIKYWSRLKSMSLTVFF